MAMKGKLMWEKSNLNLPKAIIRQAVDGKVEGNFMQDCTLHVPAHSDIKENDRIIFKVRARGGWAYVTNPVSVTAQDLIEGVTCQTQPINVSAPSGAMVDVYYVWIRDNHREESPVQEYLVR